MRPYGMQDDHSENEEERMHSRSVSATTTVKAVKAPSAKRVKCANVEQGDYGALGKANLVKLNATIKRMGDESRTMEEQLTSATVHWQSLSPRMLKELASVKTGVQAELAAIELYKESNREDDTAQLCQNGLAQLAEARQSFKVLERMLKALKTPEHVH